MKRTLSIAFLALFVTGSLFAAPPSKSSSDDGKKSGAYTADTFQGLEFRSIGPAVISGRIADIAVDPSDHHTWYVGVASGGVWKTVNSGTTWTPIFDDQKSYSIGAVTVDPKDPLVVWVGTGENNSQRSVSWGDGLYKSTDGGASWKLSGLDKSEHISKIVIDPRDSNVVWVAAQGPLWNSGGDRGLYETADGGKTWKKMLDVSADTGVTDLVFDPRNPDVMYAAAYQRRRHVWTLIDGGPESAIYRSRDGGASWEKIDKGLPKTDLGRIGLAIAPSDPDKLYAIVEAADDKSGFFRSTNGGASWEKMSDYVSSSPQYYQEIVVDPHDANRIYSMDTWLHVSEDGGKTFQRLGETWKHVDNHALWIEPSNTSHLVDGCDGGVYESFDRGKTWEFKSNLPLAQFYRLSLDNDVPFYHVYGGTQDNNTIGGPTRTSSASGIVNSDWYITVGGDGFQPRADPEDPNTVYSEYQYGGLVRYDRRSGEAVDIRPVAAPGEAPLRFNWDSPLIISPHSHTRLYFASQKIFRSDDRGNSWTAISPDLTRGLDRNKLKVMGRVWGVDTVAKNASTSFYGNIVSLSESPLQEGLIYAGTDDGLIQVTADGGQHWTKIDNVPGIPQYAYVADLETSQHDANTVYAIFENHKMGDFKPYVLESTDRGRTWKNINGDLPTNGPAWTIVEDPKDANLLFLGTEYGAFFSRDGGAKWIQLKGGIPTIAVRDLAIQPRENDLVAATYGRGFYVLDDITPLRTTSPELLQKDAVLFSTTKTAWMFMPSTPLGLKGKSFQGDSYYAGENPPFGAILTYYLKDSLESRKEARQKSEMKLEKEKKDVYYPTWEELRLEDREQKPAIVLTVKDEGGNVVRRITGPVSAGFHRVAWDLRYPAANPVEPSGAKREEDPFSQGPEGPMVAPGTYTVTLSKLADGQFTPLGDPQTVNAKPLGLVKLTPEETSASLAFERKVARLQRAVLGAARNVRETSSQIDLLQKALLDTPQADPKLAATLVSLHNRLADISEKLLGDRVVGKYNEPVPPSIRELVQGVVEGQWNTTSAPTQTQIDAYNAAAKEFAPVLNDLRTIVDVDLKNVQDAMEKAGAPWTPGRVPVWTPE
ncbi:MAG: glycosyl hydrolase [Thermoanaerobaculia bacterium]